MARVTMIEALEADARKRYQFEPDDVCDIPGAVQYWKTLTMVELTSEFDAIPK